MSLMQAHLEIAKERFLEMMAEQPGRNPQIAAAEAIAQADEFDTEYRKHGYAPAETLMYGQPVSNQKKLKGCRACYGSGGKHGDPCKACGGTGKVPA